MNKLRLYINDKIQKKSSVGTGALWVLSKGWSGLKYVTPMVAKPLAIFTAGAITLDYFKKDDPQNKHGLTDEQVEELNSSLKITLNDKFLIEYREFYKEFYKANNVESEITGYGVAEAKDGSGDLSLLNSKFTIEFNKFADKFIENNIESGKNPLGLNAKQAKVHNEKVREFIEGLKKCARKDLFKDCAKEEFNKENGPVDIFKAAKEGDPDSLDELTQARVVKPEKNKEDPYLDQDALRIKKIEEEREKYLAEERKERAERGLFEETDYETPDYGFSKVLENKNWYIRLEQKIEDQGGGLFGMYNKFKKLPVFSFVRAQDPKGRFLKSPSHVNRRYSAILMTERNSLNRTEIFDAPEYNIYPYYIKQRILILKFIKNELGSKFSNIYNKEMDEIESSNYADDGELSVMPNKLAKSLNRIIKSATVTDTYVANANKFLTYFTKLINNQYESIEEAKKDLIELKGFPEQEWGGPKFGNSGKKIGAEYNGSKEDYNTVMDIFKSVFEKDFKKVPFGSFVKFIAGTASYVEKKGDKTDKLLGVLSGLKDLLADNGAETIKELSNNPIVKPTQPRTEKPKELKRVADVDEKTIIDMVKGIKGFVTDSEVYGQSISDPVQINSGIVKIDSTTYVSTKNQSGKELYYFKEIKESDGKYYYISNPRYYFYCGAVQIMKDGAPVSYAVYATNAKETSYETMDIEGVKGNFSDRNDIKNQALFVNTSAYNINLNRGQEEQTKAQSSSGDLSQAIKTAVMEDANLTMRFNISPESMLINGKIPKDINPNDKFQLGSGKNSKVYTFQQTFEWKANVQYTLGANIIDRIGTGLIDRAMRLEKTEEYSQPKFFGAINDELSVSLSRALFNPGLYSALSQEDKFLMARLLAFIGFFSINRGYLFQKAKSDSMIQTSIQKLAALTEQAKRNIERMSKNR